MRHFTIFLLLIAFPFIAQAICVKSSRANLRSGPSTKYDKTWEVYKYMPFKLVTKRGSWLMVKDLEGDKHWIHKKLTTKDHRCAVVKVHQASLRTGPGTKYKRDAAIPRANRYTAFRLLKTKGDWAQVLAENNKKYWIARKLLWVY